MKVLKFGGTSVGSAERMHKLVELIKGNDPRIVVLSAMSGTTNSLVEISNALYEKNNKKANELINALNDKYIGVVKKLYKTEKFRIKGKEVIENHFNYLRSFEPDSFAANEEKAILA